MSSLLYITLLLHDFKDIFFTFLVMDLQGYFDEI